jgi:hypothetical protein
MPQDIRHNEEFRTLDLENQIDHRLINEVIKVHIKDSVQIIIILWEEINNERLR